MVLPPSPPGLTIIEHQLFATLSAGLWELVSPTVSALNELKTKLVALLCCFCDTETVNAESFIRYGLHFVPNHD